MAEWPLVSLLTLSTLVEGIFSHRQISQILVANIAPHEILAHLLESLILRLLHIAQEMTCAVCCFHYQSQVEMAGHSKT